jgi:curved DNA-binding protein CbpA
MTELPGPGPFAALGLPARADLTDDEVRAAWRRVAAATHPDRADGGDPARFAAAAAAYTALRTRSGRGEALGGLAGPAAWAGRGGRGQAGGEAGRVSSDRPGSRDSGRPGRIAGSLIRLPARARGGRPAVLLARLAATATVAALAVIAAGWGPASAAVITGAVTWLVLTARHDLTPPP